MPKPLDRLYTDKGDKGFVLKGASLQTWCSTWQALWPLWSGSLLGSRAAGTGTKKEAQRRPTPLLPAHHFAGFGRPALSRARLLGR